MVSKIEHGKSGPLCSLTEVFFQVDVFSFGIVLCEILARIPADPEILPRTQVPPQTTLHVPSRASLKSSTSVHSCVEIQQLIIVLL